MFSLGLIPKTPYHYRMTMLHDAYETGVNAALVKYAATRGLKEIRRSFAAGDMDRANRLAKTPGLLDNNLGSSINHVGQGGDLGRGGEGLSSLVAHPIHGISVRKAYDPAGRGYSSEIVARKEQLNNVPGMSRVLGSTTTRSGTPVHFNEYVPGTQMTNDYVMGNRGASTKLQNAQKQLSAQTHQGYQLHDLQGSNAQLTHSGQVKFIDHIPLRPDEALSLAQQQHANAGMAFPHDVLPLTAKGERLFDESTATRAKTPYVLQPAPGPDREQRRQLSREQLARFTRDEERTHNNAFKQHYF